jgi:hypothetical protein
MCYHVAWWTCTNILEEPAASITENSHLYGQCSMIKDCTVYRMYSPRFEVLVAVSQKFRCCVMWCCVVLLDEQLPPFWRIIVLSSSGSQSPRGILVMTSLRKICWTQVMKALWFSKKSGTFHLVTHHHISGDFNPRAIVKPKYRIICRSFTSTKCSKLQETWNVLPPTHSEVLCIWTTHVLIRPMMFTWFYSAVSCNLHGSRLMWQNM